MSSDEGAAQYGLFGEIEEAEAAEAAEADRRRLDAIEFLTSPWPSLLAWWCDPAEAERRVDHGEVKASYRRGRIGEPDAPGWAWAVRPDGLRFERGDEWGGWFNRPRHYIPWVALHQLREAHPAALADLRTLAAGRGRPHSLGWRWYMAPHILTPWGWHPSYYASERREDYYDGDTFDTPPPPGSFAARIRAWGIVVDLVRKLGDLR